MSVSEVEARSLAVFLQFCALTRICFQWLGFHESGRAELFAVESRGQVQRLGTRTTCTLHFTFAVTVEAVDCDQARPPSDGAPTTSTSTLL